MGHSLATPLCVPSILASPWSEVHELMRAWDLWRAPRAVRAVVLAVDLAAFALFVWAASDLPTGSDLARFSLLSVLAVGYHELTLQVERRRWLLNDGTAFASGAATMLFAGAVALPAGLAELLVLIVYTQLWMRSADRREKQKLYRMIYTACAVLLACAAAGAIAHAVGTATLGGIVAGGLAAAITYDLVNSLAVGTAMTANSRQVRARTLLGPWRNHALVLTELALGILLAASLLTAPWFAILVLPAAFLAQHHQLLAELVAAATTDSKTELLNAATWRRLAEHLLATAARRQLPAALLVLDLDRFKDFNDTHGHLAGDAALRLVGDAITTELRAHDAAGRFGGEEFAVLLLDVDADTAARIADRVRQRVAGIQVDIPAVPGGQSGNVTVSIGIASYPTDGEQLDELVHAGDLALYEAKHAGRNAVRAARTTSRSA
jgi:diguanylate cyclase (GGDEF)-like protein